MIDRHAKPATQVTRSSGNVFADLGFDDEEAEHLRIRSELMAALRSLIYAQGLTQQGAAALLGTTQPRVSDLVRGRIERFSIDMLVTLLARAGVRVDLVAGARPLPSARS